MAAWRCKLVRDATVIFLGMAILLSGRRWMYSNDSHLFLMQNAMRKKHIDMLDFGFKTSKHNVSCFLSVK